MTTVIGGSNPAVTFPDGTTQTTAFTSTPSLTTVTTTGDATFATSSGNVSVGTSSPYAKIDAFQATAGYGGWKYGLNLSGTDYPAMRLLATTGNTGNIIAHEAGSLVFLKGTTSTSAGAEAMRIDTNGNWMLGTTTPQSLATIWRTVNGSNLQITNTSSTFTSTLQQNSGYAVGSTGWYALVCQSGNGSAVSTNTCLIYGNGNIVNGNNSYGGISDIKLKENIVDASPKLEKLLQVKVRSYTLKGDYEKHKQLGVVAQELEQIFPSLVEEAPDRDLEGNDLGTTTKQVKYSVFVPMLIKAIQELNAKVEALEAK